MDYYEAWFDIRDSQEDLEFAADLARYMGYSSIRSVKFGLYRDFPDLARSQS